MQKTILVPFNGKTITAFMYNGQPVIAMKPIVENMGLDWRAQRQRILRHPVLSTSVVMITTQMSEDDQNRDFTCLPINMLNGWLFGVDTNRVKPHIRDTIVSYQKQCFHVLADYFGLNFSRNEILQDKRNAHAPMMVALVEHRADLGKETDERHFMTENKLCNWAVTGEFKGVSEKDMTQDELLLLTYSRRVNESLILLDMDYDARKLLLLEKVSNKRKKLMIKALANV